MGTPRRFERVRVTLRGWQGGGSPGRQAGNLEYGYEWEEDAGGQIQTSLSCCPLRTRMPHKVPPPPLQVTALTPPRCAQGSCRSQCPPS